MASLAILAFLILVLVQVLTAAADRFVNGGVKDRLMTTFPQLADVVIHIEPPPQ